MKILVDADACPLIIKEILYRAAKRCSVLTSLYANQPLMIPSSPFIKFIQVDKGFDVADQRIIDDAVKGDLVVTADIPLAASVIEKGAFALNPRGEFYTQENISQKLAMRNLMTDLRSQGEITGGPGPLNKRHQQDFANALDRFLNQ
jgi:uncharacterized protein YaiI (UPF0178 family)